MAEKLKYTQQTLGTALRNTWRSIDKFNIKKHNFFHQKLELNRLGGILKD